MLYDPDETHGQRAHREREFDRAQEQRDPIATNQSKYVDGEGVLRYQADDSEVFPGPTGVRRWHADR